MGTGLMLFQHTVEVKVVMKDGYFPHLENDCLKRANFLKSDGLKILKNNQQVKFEDDNIWIPKL